MKHQTVLDLVMLGYALGAAEAELDAMSPLDPEVLEFALKKG